MTSGPESSGPGCCAMRIKSVKRAVFIGILVFFLALTGLLVSHMSLSALKEPGRMETYLASQAKRFLIGRASREDLPPEPAVSLANIAEGEKLFGAECAMCHGSTGPSPPIPAAGCIREARI